MNTKDIDHKEAADKVLEVGRDKAAKHFKCNPSTFRDFLTRNNLPTRKAPTGENKPGVSLKDGNSGEITGKVGENDAERLLVERGFNLDEWYISGVTANKWDSPTGETLEQSKVQIKRKTPIDFLEPARIDGPKFKAKKVKIPKDGVLAVIGGDAQAPFHDPVLQEKKNQFIADNKVDIIVEIGDTNDFPTISRYKANPEQEEIATVNKCINAGGQILKNRREAAPDAEIVKLIGNHDVRLRDYVLNHAPHLFGISKAQWENEEEQQSVLSLSNLLRLDELDIKLVGDHADYKLGQHNITKHLAARHGWIATKGSGSSALKTLDKLGFSIIVGHTHRLGLVHKTTHDIDGNLTVLTAAESGCECRVDINGGGFSPAPDWQPGYVTAQIWPDGKFSLDLVKYVNGDLLWRGNRY